MANSKKRCKHCRAYTSEWVTFPAGTFCTVEHALAFAQQPAQREKAYKAKTAERKMALLSTDKRHWIKKAQEAFNGYIRDRDSGLPCVSCDRSEAEVNQSEGWKPGGAWDCGHYLSVGSHPELRFEPLNAHRQCKSCNGGSGNYTRKNHQVAAAYRAELVKRIGLEKVEWLEGPYVPKKHSIEDLQAIAAEYRIKRRELQKGHHEDIEYA
ncbi:MAG: NinG family protein [Thalassobium sp.]|nr:MAG: NinG family protein [Thalassobium sp.]